MAKLKRRIRPVPQNLAPSHQESAVAPILVPIRGRCWAMPNPVICLGEPHLWTSGPCWSSLYKDLRSGSPPHTQDNITCAPTCIARSGNFLKCHSGRRALRAVDDHTDGSTLRMPYLDKHEPTAALMISDAIARKRIPLSNRKASVVFCTPWRADMTAERRLFPATHHPTRNQDERATSMHHAAVIFRRKMYAGSPPLADVPVVGEWACCSVQSTLQHVNHPNAASHRTSIGNQCLPMGPLTFGGERLCCAPNYAVLRWMPPLAVPPPFSLKVCTVHHQRVPQRPACQTNAASPTLRSNAMSRQLISACASATACCGASHPTYRCLWCNRLGCRPMAAECPKNTAGNIQAPRPCRS